MRPLAAASHVCTETLVVGGVQPTIATWSLISSQSYEENTMQRLVAGILEIWKESVKTVSREGFNTTVRILNGVSEAVLALFPSGANSIHPLRPSFGSPTMPQWMEEGVSSFNTFILELVADRDSTTESSGYDSEGASSSDGSGQSLPAHHHHYHHRNQSMGHTRRQDAGSRSGIVGKLKKTVFAVLKVTLWPLIVVVWLSKRPRRSSADRESNGGLSRTSSSGSLMGMAVRARRELDRRVHEIREYATHLNDYRRRGLIEDLQLTVELVIEKWFDFLKATSNYLLSPWMMVKVVANRGRQLVFGVEQPCTSVRVESESRLQRLGLALNTDDRTCEDIIRDTGYPYEAMKVTTEDGYILKLERIPRPESRKVVFMQHGLLDSALGWLSNGVTGSQAFAAYDHGFDVFLGNFRGYSSKEHVNTNISAASYWKYSINEHGVQDIPAMVDKIHEIKCAELAEPNRDSIRRRVPQEGSSSIKSDGGDEAEEAMPYSLSVIAHSLGGAATLIYVVTRQLQNIPHRLSRIILLSPAGFHMKSPTLFDYLSFLVPLVDPLMKRFVPGIYIPTRGLRLLFNKLTQDFQNLPALKALVQVIISSVVSGGDTSDWVGALRNPHYNMNKMPGVSYLVMMHLRQMKSSGRFALYDYGNARMNIAAYGSPTPPDIGAHYHLINVPVDVVLGRNDKLIPQEMVLRHYEIMKSAGCDVSVKDFEYGHLEFLVTNEDELISYVMSRLVIPKSRAIIHSASDRSLSSFSPSPASLRRSWTAHGNLRSAGSEYAAGSSVHVPDGMEANGDVRRLQDSNRSENDGKNGLVNAATKGRDRGRRDTRGRLRRSSSVSGGELSRAHMDGLRRRAVSSAVDLVHIANAAPPSPDALAQTGIVRSDGVVLRSGSGDGLQEFGQTDNQLQLGKADIDGVSVAETSCRSAVSRELCVADQSHLSSYEGSNPGLGSVYRQEGNGNDEKYAPEDMGKGKEAQRGGRNGVCNSRESMPSDSRRAAC
ncbi:hypothetical protein CBR_g165 [Chara braunii]|uniref:Partial AB-hydrolase lipase domain-containing protein n=1 Tax=Chara braunii TaxID=69332 RepID=A0A388JM02_CHABU|nr:hypothetical protein CBR_g165 [Chara braunii]|eukprot:GBG58765.1 hypothetical protein CBR_g165 [Chara braunii]